MSLAKAETLRLSQCVFTAPLEQVRTIQSGLQVKPADNNHSHVKSETRSLSVMHVISKNQWEDVQCASDILSKVYRTFENIILIK